MGELARALSTRVFGAADKGGTRLLLLVNS